MFIEKSANSFGQNVYCSFERTDTFHISDVTFYFNRFSGKGVCKAMGRFRIQLLLEDNTWSTRYNTPKNAQ